MFADVHHHPPHLFVALRHDHPHGDVVGPHDQPLRHDGTSPGVDPGPGPREGGAIGAMQPTAFGPDCRRRQHDQIAGEQAVREGASFVRLDHWRIGGNDPIDAPALDVQIEAADAAPGVPGGGAVPGRGGCALRPEPRRIPGGQDGARRPNGHGLTRRPRHHDGIAQY